MANNKTGKRKYKHGGRREGTGSVSPRGGATATVTTRILVTTRDQIKEKAEAADKSISGFVGDLLEDLYPNK